jgi:rSAM/selenodomain-associated transferase 1
MNKTAVMLFARTPVPGKVKTRLIPALGAQGAYRLHRAMLNSSIARLLQVEADELQLWLADSGVEGDQGFVVPAALSLHRQYGDDLGLRMAHGFRHNFDLGCSGVIVVGSDCPQLRLEHYQQVLSELERHDAVIIPALDGGYVLLGLRRYHHSLFIDIPWGEDCVYRRTVDKLEVLGWRWCSLDALADIDRPEDLVYLEGLELDCAQLDTGSGFDPV